MSEQYRREHGIVLCPDLDKFSLASFIDLFDEVQPHAGGWIELWINGVGGSTVAETAICDYIALHGKIRGVIFGEANSAHGLIWASCQRRAVGRNAVLGVHRTQYSPSPNANYTTTDFQRAVRESSHWDKRAAKCYAKISNKPAKFWLKAMENAGNGLSIFTAKQLVKFDMAEWYIP